MKISMRRAGLGLGVVLCLQELQHVAAWTSQTTRRGIALRAPITRAALRNTDDASSEDAPLEALMQSCRSACTSAVLGGLIMLFPGPLAADLPFPLLLSARADETVLTETQIPAPPTLNSMLESDSFALAPETEMPPPPTLNSLLEADSGSFMLASEPAKISSMEEVWNLVNKYFIDRTFNGQDWDEVHDKYSGLIAKASTEEQKVKLTTEMVKTLGDKYSRMLDPNAYAAIQKYDLIGVGVTLMPNSAKQIIVGAPPIAGSAAAKAGLAVGDFVTAVNGIPTQGRTAFDIIDQISENPNAQSISMSITPKDHFSDDAGEIREETMSRQFAEVKNPVRYKLSETRADGTKVGFVKILEFNSLVKPKLEDALKSLEAAGANAYVLDLRMNTGGAFQSAVEISSLFMEDRVATTVVDSANKELPFRTQKGKMIVDAEDPMVVWIDGYSASASEVLAGSLHDNCRAVLMGDKSFGKGLIQAVYGLGDGAGLVLTVAHYVTPAGTDIQGVGIVPDIQGHVPLPVPGMSTDTSGVDFIDIRNRLSPSMCHAPESALQLEVL